MELLPDGQVKVEWTVEGNCEGVDVAWGSSPERIDHQGRLTARARTGQAVIDEPPPGPLYVSVSPSGGGGAVVAGIRRLGLAGPTNFRDLGGYPAGTRRVRWGRVFRSDALIIEETAFEHFNRLGIKTVFDLRSDEERQTNPNRLPDGDYRVRHVPLIGENSARNAIEAGLSDGEAFLAELYTGMLEQSAPVFGEILGTMADESALPVVFHCAAGKDRTGMVAAILLLALGVEEETILDDYELTSQFRTPDQVNASMARLEQAGTLIAEAVAGILRTPRWAMQKAVSAIEDIHGGIDGFLTGPAGLSAESLERLRKNLLV